MEVSFMEEVTENLEKTTDLSQVTIIILSHMAGIELITLVVKCTEGICKSKYE